MSETNAGRVPGDLGHGTLGRLTGAVYRYVVLTALLLLTVAPTLVVLLLLDRSPGNAPVAVLSGVLVGPALSATLYATRDRSDDGASPAASFLRGLRQNTADVLRVWVPALVLLALVAAVLVGGGAGVPVATKVVLAGVAVVVLTVTLHAVAIVSFYGFRTRDALRLAAYYAGRMPLVSLGTLSLVVLAAGIVVIGTEAALAALGVAWVHWWYRNDARLLAEVGERFTTAGAGAGR